MEELIYSLMYGDEIQEEIIDDNDIDEQIDNIILERLQQEDKNTEWVLIEENNISYKYQAKNKPYYYKEVAKNGNWETTYKEY